ncbi:hypothetical protein ACJX0J_010780, partial [Zea mays]
SQESQGWPNFFIFISHFIVIALVTLFAVQITKEHPFIVTGVNVEVVGFGSASN